MGSGLVRVNGQNANAVDLGSSGSGNVRAGGEATKLTVGVAGSGDVQAADLKADEVSVSIAGSRDVTYSGDAAVKSRQAGSGNTCRRT